MLNIIADYIECNYKNCKVYIGKLYNNKDNVTNKRIVAIYSQRAKNNIAIENLSTYKNAEIKILVHYSTNYCESEKASNDIYSLLNCKEYKNLIFFCEHSYPICVGTDDYGIWEFVINLNVIVKE